MQTSPVSTSQSQPGKVWFITGASTGFGRQLAEELLRQGERVIATARSLDKVADLEAKHPGQAKAYSLDVTDPAQIASVVAQSYACFAPVDVLVNNAGFGLVGAVEEATDEEFLPVFQTNVIGLIRVTRAFLPRMRERGSGHIVNMSSIGGLIPMPGWSYYHASKSAVDGFSQALAGEVEPLGIRVTAIEPGGFRTGFGRSGREAAEHLPAYAQATASARDFLRKVDQLPGDPERAAKAIISAVNSPEPPRHLILGSSALDRYRKYLAERSKEVDQWEAASRSTDFPAPAQVSVSDPAPSGTSAEPSVETAAK